MDRFKKDRKTPDQMERVILLSAYENRFVPYYKTQWGSVRERCIRKGYLYHNGWLSAKGRLALHYSGLRPFKDKPF